MYKNRSKNKFIKVLCCKSSFPHIAQENKIPRCMVYNSYIVANSMCRKEQRTLKVFCVVCHDRTTCVIKFSIRGTYYLFDFCNKALIYLTHTRFSEHLFHFQNILFDGNLQHLRLVYRCFK